MQLSLEMTNIEKAFFSFFFERINIKVLCWANNLVITKKLASYINILFFQLYMVEMSRFCRSEALA